MVDYQWLREEVLVRKRDVGFSPSSSIEEVVHYAYSLLGKHIIERRYVRTCGFFGYMINDQYPEENEKKKTNFF